MDIHTFEFFQREIEDNCEFVLFAWEDMERARKEGEAASARQFAGSNQGLMPLDPQMQQWSAEHRVAFNRQWYSALNFLVAVGNVSKIFFPSAKTETVEGVAIDTRDRAQTLKAAFGIDHNKSLLRKTRGINTIRDLRDRFEHFDVRIDAWAAQSSPGPLYDKNVGLEPATSEPFVMRAINPVTYTMRCRDNEQPLLPVVEEIVRLLDLASADDGERIYWRFEDDRLVFRFTGAWLERSIYESRRAWLEESGIPNHAGITLWQYRGAFARMIDNAPDVCTRCKEAVTPRDNGYWCSACQIWRPKDLSPSW